MSLDIVAADREFAAKGGTLDGAWDWANDYGPDLIMEVHRLRGEIELRSHDDRELLALWMIENSYATGHGDTFADLLAELSWQHAERAAIREQDAAS